MPFSLSQTRAGLVKAGFIIFCFSLTLLLGFFSFANRAFAEERIIEFHSYIEVQPDSSLLVREEIKVKAEGNKIKRGIFRDFPVMYQDETKGSYSVDFEVREVLRDGQQEDYHLERQDAYERIYIGSRDVFLSPGVYTYSLSYYTKGHLNFFKDHDELYWNVTGDKWDFKIEEARASVRLPKRLDKEAIQYQAYTGSYGSRVANYEAWVDQEGEIQFKTTKPLSYQEGLTIVVGWPKGLVKESEKKYLDRSSKEEMVYGLLVLVILLLYYYLIWLKVGKDPKGGAVIPLFHPPQDYSPAALRFIKRMGFDDKAFAASLINLAVQGNISIKKEVDDFEIEKTSSKSQPVFSDESALLDALPDSLKLENKNYQTVGRVKEALVKALNARYGKNYFIKNTKFLIPGILLSLLGLFYVLMPHWGFYYFLEKIDALVIFAWMSGAAMALLVLWPKLRDQWKQVWQVRGLGFFVVIKAIGMGLLGLILVAALLGGFVGLFVFVSLAMALLITLMLVINIGFYEWLKAPTIKGRALLDQAAGFKLFLSVTEKERLAFVHPPELTPELFEKYLPYALALDVELFWAEQ
ncbi:MAG: DUF2207 domain-containing protein, partial [Deltaproteobacteria bacterium]|nr:DUF2207 domain-containing protein [Deltaproteobacteria bacterium]